MVTFVILLPDLDNWSFFWTPLESEPPIHGIMSWPHSPHRVDYNNPPLHIVEPDGCHTSRLDQCEPASLLSSQIGLQLS